MGDLEGVFKVIWVFAFIGLLGIVGGLLYGMYSLLAWIF